MCNHFQHTLAWISHCQGSPLTGWNVSLDMTFQKGLVAKWARQLIKPKMFFFHMTPTIGLHGEVCCTNCTYETTFQALFSDHKVLDPWNNRKVMFDTFIFRKTHLLKELSVSTLHRSTIPLESLVSGNTKMFLLHMPCTAAHVPNHFVAHCAQVTSVSSQNKILNAWNRHRYQDDPSLSETVLPTGTDVPK